ncbi:MAG: hypothetical protein AAF328_11965, partial [Planctomycetota bacterium]
MKRNPHRLLGGLRLLLGLSLCVLALAGIPQETNPSAPATASAAPPPTAGQRVLNAMPSGGQIAVIPVQGIIYGYTTESIERRVDRAIAAGANII